MITLTWREGSLIRHTIGLGNLSRFRVHALSGEIRGVVQPQSKFMLLPRYIVHSPLQAKA